MSDSVQPAGGQELPRDGVGRDVIELRVHGASGMEADQILDRPHVHQVAGDHSGGFYRPRPGYGDERSACGVLIEAYRWGGMPSGTAVRTLSLVFLLPFMLCNVSVWMHPRASGAGTIVRSICRVLALSLTTLYVLSIVGVALDLIAWRCLSLPECTVGRSWLSWLFGRPVGLRLAVLALVPATAIGLAWRLGSRPERWFDSFRAPAAAPAGDSLSSVAQRDRMPLVGRLRLIHVVAAFATLDASLLAARAGQGSPVTTRLLLAVALSMLATCVVLLCLPAAIDRREEVCRFDAALRGLRATAGGLTVVVLTLLVLGPTPSRVAGGLPGYGPTMAWLFVTQTALLAVLVLTVMWNRDGRRGGRGLLRSMGAPVFAAFAVGLGVTFATELNYRVADYLDRDAPTTAELPTSPALAYRWTMFGFFMAVSASAIVGGGLAAVSRRARTRAAARIVAHDFPNPPPAAAARVERVKKVIAKARFTEHLGRLAVVYACLAALGLTASALSLLELQPNLVMTRLVGVPSDFVSTGTQFGSYLTALVFLGLMVGGLFAYRTTGFRRYVGVLWDLAMFWPRGAHPFALPCYTERAVPELTSRISHLVARGNLVVISAHSHGCVLVAASVLQLRPQVQRRVALLTHGCPLRRLYAGLFPAYVGEDVLHELGERVGWRWVNLWRDTDPIGGWIFSADRPGETPAADGPPNAVDRRLRDPREVTPPQYDSVAPSIQG